MDGTGDLDGYAEEPAAMNPFYARASSRGPTKAMRPSSSTSRASARASSSVRGQNNLVEQRHPDKSVLDAVSTDVPVLITHRRRGRPRR